MVWTFQVDWCLSHILGLAHKSDARRTTDQNLICGLKRIKWERDNWAYGCNFQDDSLILEISMKGEDCGPECNRADECTHFTYSNKNQKCKLLSGDKASKEDALVSPDHDQICGVVYPDQIDWQVDNYAHFCQFVGGDVFNEKTEPDQCGPECRTSPRCTHFTWQNGICYFKGGVVSKDSAVLRRDKHSICGFIEWCYLWILSFKDIPFSSCLIEVEQVGYMTQLTLNKLDIWPNWLWTSWIYDPIDFEHISKTINTQLLA